MKLKDILKESKLFESVTITVYEYDTKEKKHDFLNYNRERVICEYCDGDAQDYEGNICRHCKGLGFQYADEIVPEMNVSNLNFETVAQLLGIEFDYAGCLDSKKLPEYRRKLVSLMNQPTERFTREYSKERGDTRMDTSGEVPEIKRGPELHIMPLTDEKIKRYIEQLIIIIDFAQKNNGSVCWG